MWPPREASTSLPSSHDQQLALLAVLEGLAHDAHVREALEGFVTKHCELFPPDSEAEIPLVCTEIHTSYQKLFERSLERIAHPERQLRNQSARALLSWPDTQPWWYVILRAYLRGALELTSSELSRLASELDEWPTHPAMMKRARVLLTRLSSPQRQALITRVLEGWLERWRAGDSEATLDLQQLTPDERIAYLSSRVLEGELDLARWLSPSSMT